MTPLATNKSGQLPCQAFWEGSNLTFHAFHVRAYCSKSQIYWNYKHLLAAPFSDHLQCNSLFLKALSYFFKVTPPYPQRMSLSALRCGTPKLQQRKGRNRRIQCFTWLDFFLYPTDLFLEKCSTALFWLLRNWSVMYRNWEEQLSREKLTWRKQRRGDEKVLES